jgi:hypothetical protein
MKEMTGQSWLHRGSSVVFDKNLLAPLVTKGGLISLREILTWVDAWPDDPPNNSKTVFVSGLETILGVLPPKESEEFLHKQMKPLIQEFQEHWDTTGLVFGFCGPSNKFEIDPHENVIYKISDTQKVQLSSGLWNGNASQDMFLLLVKDTTTNKSVQGGFHVPRLS